MVDAMNSEEMGKFLSEITPIFEQAFKDDVPNVRFTACKIAGEFKASKIDWAFFKTNLQQHKEDPDRDVMYYANLAL